MQDLEYVAIVNKQIISFKFKSSAKATKEAISTVEEVQSKKLNLHTETDWNV